MPRHNCLKKKEVATSNASEAMTASRSPTTTRTTTVPYTSIHLQHKMCGRLACLVAVVPAGHGKITRNGVLSLVPLVLSCRPQGWPQAH